MWTAWPSALKHAHKWDCVLGRGVCCGYGFCIGWAIPEQKQGLQTIACLEHLCLVRVLVFILPTNVFVLCGAVLNAKRRDMTAFRRPLPPCLVKINIPGHLSLGHGF